MKPTPLAARMTLPATLVMPMRVNAARFLSTCLAVVSLVITQAQPAWARRPCAGKTSMPKCSSRRLRVNGRGIPAAATPGDLYLELDVAVPSPLTDAQRAAAAALEKQAVLMRKILDGASALDFCSYKK